MNSFEWTFSFCVRSNIWTNYETINGRKSEKSINDLKKEDPTFTEKKKKIKEESSLDSDISKLKKKKGKQKEKVNVFLVYFSFVEKLGDEITNKDDM